MLFLVCSRCEEAKWLHSFRTRIRNGTESYRSQCKSCESKQQVNRARSRMREDPIFKEESLRRVTEWGKKNKERRQMVSSKRRKERYSEDSVYRARIKAQAAEYRARKGRATLGEGDSKELQRIYLECPQGFEVDHIVPLKNSIVCGLHVPWNLQYLPPSVNRSKNNAFDPSLAFFSPLN